VPVSNYQLFGSLSKANKSRVGPGLRLLAVLGKS